MAPCSSPTPDFSRWDEDDYLSVDYFLKTFGKPLRERRPWILYEPCSPLNSAGTRPGGGGPGMRAASRLRSAVSLGRDHRTAREYRRLETPAGEPGPARIVFGRPAG